MSLNTRRELIQSIAQRYHAANKPDKNRILDELVAATGYHRKAATRLLNNPPPKPSKKTPRHRARRYDDEVSMALIILWEAADRICSKRLVPFLPDLIEVLERHGHLQLDDSVRQCLQADRQTAPWKPGREEVRPSADTLPAGARLEGR